MLQRNITANYNTYWNSPLCFDKVRNFPLHISYPNAPLQIETKIHAATSVMLSTTIHTYLTNVSNIKPDKLFVSCSGSRQLPLGTLTLNINSSYIESSIYYLVSVMGNHPVSYPQSQNQLAKLMVSANQSSFSSCHKFTWCQHRQYKRLMEPLESALKLDIYMYFLTAARGGLLISKSLTKVLQKHDH